MCKATYRTGTCRGQLAEGLRMQKGGRGSSWGVMASFTAIAVGTGPPYAVFDSVTQATGSACASFC